MKLIRKLGTRISKTGRLQSWGLYQCPNSVCNKQVERQLSNGKIAKSCGCQQHSEVINKKISDSKKDKKTKPCSEETKNKIRLGNIGKKRTEEQKQRISKRQIGVNNPNYGKEQSQELKQKLKEIRRTQIREKAPNWNGGTSFLPYPPEFNKELKQFILRRDNYECQDFNCEHKTNILDIHHIDYDKNNNNPENLTTLCHSCHSKTNGKNNRQYWTNYYQNIMINKLIECLL